MASTIEVSRATSREPMTIAAIRKEERRESNWVRFGVALNDQVINPRVLRNR